MILEHLTNLDVDSRHLAELSDSNDRMQGVATLETEQAKVKGKYHLALSSLLSLLSSVTDATQ